MLSRIAPTPSGFLHLGNAANFLLTAAMVKAQAGQLLLRIDDLDQQRLRPDYVENIFASLDYLNIHIDFGPRSPQALQRSWSQQHRLPLYHLALDKLLQTKQVYACDCSRKRLQSLPGGLYDGHCRDRNLPLRRSGIAWRIRVDEQVVAITDGFQETIALVNLAIQMGDFVIRKKDGLPAYQLSSVVDDLYFGVTHIVRGMDLLPSSAAQSYLLVWLGEKQPWTYYHHPLLLTPEGEKLSKSAGASALLQEAPSSMGLAAARAVVLEWLATKQSVYWRSLETYL